MENNLNWEELFTIGGFLLEALSPTKFRLDQVDDRNIEFLHRLLDEDGIKYKKTLDGIEVISPPPTFEEWVELLYKIGGGGEENGPAKRINLENVDVPILAVVRQLNRIGLSTMGSCSGHVREKNPPRTYAYIDFQVPTTAKIALELITRMGYNANWRRVSTVGIQEDHSRLFELGLELSKTQNIDGLRKQLLEKREHFLEELLMIPGETGNEGAVQACLLKTLPRLMDDVRQDGFGNILGIRRFGFGPTILLSAHMDTIYPFTHKSQLVKDGMIWRRDQGILGADDRAGIAMILNTLKDLSKHNFRGCIKIVFTVWEEQGQQGAENLDPAFYSDVDYAISLDRKNGTDIITRTSTQQYCDVEYGRIFEEASSYLWGGVYPYKMETGKNSDLRVWSKAGIPCVNLSIGYYNEHTPDEYLNLDEWHRTQDLVLHVIERLSTKYRRERRNLCTIRSK